MKADVRVPRGHMVCVDVVFPSDVQAKVQVFDPRTGSPLATINCGDPVLSWDSDVNRGASDDVFAFRAYRFRRRLDGPEQEELPRGTEREAEDAGSMTLRWSTADKPSTVPAAVATILVQKPQ